MAISQVYYGSVALGTIGATNYLSSYPDTNSGVYQIFIDTTNFAVGQYIELSINNYFITASDLFYVAYPSWGCGLWVSPAFTLSNQWFVAFSNKSGSSATTMVYGIRKVG